MPSKIYMSLAPIRNEWPDLHHTLTTGSYVIYKVARLFLDGEEQETSWKQSVWSNLERKETAQFLTILNNQQF